jgi:hypothetical protein
MVNSKSATFQFSEKVGVLIGTTFRYILMGGVIVFLGRKLNGCIPTPVPNPPGIN